MCRRVVAQFYGGGAVCGASDQRRVGSVGFRKEERPQHGVLSAGTAGLRVVRTQEQYLAVSRSFLLLRVWPDGEAAGDYVSVRSPADGLLAAAAGGFRRGRGKVGNPAAAFLVARRREDSFVRPFTGECARHDEGADRRDPSGTAVPGATGECADLVRGISVEVRIACGPCAVVSASDAACERVARCNGGIVAGADHDPGDGRAKAAVHSGGLVLVSGNDGSDDRAGAGRCAIDGRSLCVHSVHWLVDRAVLGRSRPAGATRGSVVCDRGDECGCARWIRRNVLPAGW